MAKSIPKAPADCVALYEALVATLSEVERKGATMPYTSVNGNMFSLLTPDGTLALRLATADREAFLTRHKTTLCEQYGVVMKEYVCVPAPLLKRTRDLAKYFEASYRYACTLKPKTTTGKKAAIPNSTARKVRTAKQSPKKR